MARWVDLLMADLDAAEERARKLTAGLSTEQLNWQPTAGTWSVGQCLDHLRVMNDVYLPPVEVALAGKPKRAVEEITPGWFGRWFLRSFVEPSATTKKVKAPSKSAPASKVDGTVLERLLRGNENLRGLLRRASEYDVNRIRFKNPFVPMIRFTVGTGLTIVVRHEHRHLLQAERVKASNGFPQK
ncbi:MAG: hypothetical protein NVS9B14_19970 [Candidatus Acidiferrum sp.]